MTICGLEPGDHVFLGRLVAEMYWRIDHGGGETLTELWTEDGEMWSGGKLHGAGHEAIAEFGRTRLPEGSARHTVANLRFEADGPDRAKGTIYEVVYFAHPQREGPGATLPLLVGDLEFHFARRGDGWLISKADFLQVLGRREESRQLAQAATD
jgi:SnoaL-like domain